MTQLKVDQDQLALLRMGIKPGHLKQQYLKHIKTTPTLRQDFDKIKGNLKSMVDEDEFLEVITTAHRNISEIPENNKVIVQYDNTFQIRAINPQQIQSLTERAFFNSFNLQRVVLNDQQEQDKLNNDKDGNSSRRNILTEGQFKMRGVDQQATCQTCKKFVPNATWVQCSRGEKCRGSSWYHVECAGFDQKETEKLDEVSFTCEFCKRQQQQNPDADSQSQVQKK